MVIGIGTGCLVQVGLAWLHIGTMKKGRLEKKLERSPAPLGAVTYYFYIQFLLLETNIPRIPFTARLAIASVHITSSVCFTS